MDLWFRISGLLYPHRILGQRPSWASLGHCLGETWTYERLLLMSASIGPSLVRKALAQPDWATAWVQLLYGPDTEVDSAMVNLVNIFGAEMNLYAQLSGFKYSHLIA